MSSSNDPFALLIQNQMLPPYVTDGSWRPWEQNQICPGGYTCQAFAGQSFGAFNCDELRRIAVEEYGFGDVLAGIWCPFRLPEQGFVWNCPKGSYCPDSTTNIECPQGMYCDIKTSSLTLEGGAMPCERCGAGTETETQSTAQMVTQWVIFCLLCLIVLSRIVIRFIRIDNEKLLSALAIDTVMEATKGEGEVQRVDHKKEQEKYSKLRPKLELIAERLRKIRNNSANDSPPPQDDDIFYVTKSGDIVFDANAFFDVIDKNKDGVLSFTELNEIMCLGEDQLNAFIANMQARMPQFERRATRHLGTVTRETFVKCFLDALADAAHLEPTREEAERLFLEIAEIVEEAGNTPTTRAPSRLSLTARRLSVTASNKPTSLSVSYDKLHTSPALTSFLSDMQIYGIVSRFKKKQREEGGKVGEISQEEFVELYPRFLGEVMRPDFTTSLVKSSKSDGLDITFQNLCLAVKIGNDNVNVLDDVTGRFRSRTMVAVMGGTGSGKSSLLNALCGRAHYGKVSGKVFVNGNESKIEDQKGVIGFVPQEDIVYPDLTVKENLLYAGRLTLPAGTTSEEIVELAEEVMASLGLRRIANSLVGDARRRGISGGEKKRVNVGIELMKKPKLLFLDEPTSGLDARAAFLVMESLKRLVSSQGVTVVAVIHQPRTDIYDMFDSLMLLGIGGRTVYHGPAEKCKEYFEKMGYRLKEGESQADWFLDISSGDIEMSLDGTTESDIEDGEESRVLNPMTHDAALVKAQMAREELYRQWSVHFKALSEPTVYNPPEAFALPIIPKKVPGWRQLLIQLRRNSLLSWRNIDARLIDAGIIIIAIFFISLLVNRDPPGHNPEQLIWMKFVASAEEAAELLASVFGYSKQRIINLQIYCMMAAVITGVLVGLSATKIITEKQLQFFREAQGGVSATAYYLAANITSTVEQGTVSILASVIAYLVRNPEVSIVVYIWNFFMVSWLAVSWALFLSLILPPNAVTVVVGAWMAIFGLLFSGVITPGEFNDLYGSNFFAVFAGFVSPARFFVEGIAVSAAKCLPVQSGFPAGENAFNRPKYERSFPYYQGLTAMAQTDLVGAETFGCNGWYWWVGAAFAVGITIRIAAGMAIHSVGRAKQGKNPFFKEVVADFRGVTGRTRSVLQSFILRSLVMFVVFAGFAVLSGWLILREST